MQRRHDVDVILNPRRVAVIASPMAGARDKYVAQLAERFEDRFTLVDPAAGDLDASLRAIPDAIDVGVIDLPAEDLCTATQACADRGVAGVVVLTSLPPEHASTERRLVEIVAASGMRMVGPNGSLNLYEPMPEPPSASIPKIGLITQSGHMGRVMIQSHRHGIAFSRWIPTSNEGDLDSADFIEYLAYDDSTAVIAGYFEGFRDGVRLRRALAAAAEQHKPVVLIKVGRHQAAARMAETHSAHLAGTDAAMDGLFKQHGVVRVDDVDELLETAALFAKLARPPAGGGVALYGISGGAVALMADQAEAHGIDVPALSAETQRRLHEIVPADLGVANPVDPGNLYRTGTSEDRASMLRLIGEDPAVDVVVCALTGVIKGITDDFVADIVAFRAATAKAVVTTWNTWEMDTPAYSTLVASGIPIFRTFRGCFGALSAMIARERRMPIVTSPRGDATPVRASGGRRRRLDPADATELLRRAGVDVAPERFVASAEEAVHAAAQLGFPVVLKAHVADTAHKTDRGLVMLDLETPDEVVAAFAELRNNAGAGPLDAGTVFQVQRQLGGTEVIVGLAPDPVLGPGLLVGSGGIFAEISKDVSVRPLPVSRLDLEEMVRELECFPVLAGSRGRPAADIDRLIELLSRVAAVIGDSDNRIVELDLNPVLARRDGATVVDSVVIVDI
jgi:acyl-CoA synthetase (NDP forming)